NLDHLYIDDGFYSLETLKDAIHTQVSNELPESIMDSIREVRDYFEESTILQGIDVIYDRQFLTEQRRLADKLGYQELLTEVIAFIDLTNITTMARGIL
ncbi:V-type ATPase subunit, partial [Staphylococcus aureus]